jgi:hypothetical protein
MLHITTYGRQFSLIAVALCASVLAQGVLAAAAPPVGAAPTQANPPAAGKSPAAKSDKDEESPPYHEYKGVRIGMTADEARKALGVPTDKGDQQDFYVFSDNETAQVFYDAQKKVVAVATVYVGAAGGVPAPRAVLGTEIEPKADGSLYKMVTYPKAGFWVSYSRTAGEAPITSITMQKKQ